MHGVHVRSTGGHVREDPQDRDGVQTAAEEEARHAADWRLSQGTHLLPHPVLTVCC